MLVCVSVCVSHFKLKGHTVFTLTVINHLVLDSLNVLVQKNPQFVIPPTKGGNMLILLRAITEFISRVHKDNFPFHFLPRNLYPFLLN